jgi:3-(3-hydroxy-phenyl)propionate hydroxylase
MDAKTERVMTTQTDHPYQTPVAEKPFSGAGYSLPTYDFVTPPELSADGRGSDTSLYPVVIVGAGLAGLTAACDLAARGVSVVLIDDDNTVGVRGASSRGICYAQKSLEIFSRLGTYDQIKQKGIQWSVGKTMAGNEIVYSFDLNESAQHNASVQPPFINLQQFYIEWFLVDKIQTQTLVDLRWKTRVTQCQQTDDHVLLNLECPAGQYSIRAQWVLDASGIRSPIRDGFGLKTNPAVGEDRWCISDVKFKTRPPIERWTWVQAPFNENRAVWQHLMGDDVWRLDYQMAPDADPDYVSRADVVDERLRRQFGDDVDYELIWVGPYGYRSHVIEQMQLGRVFFLGDSAHVMSPFGARGGNSAIQDADNLGWKLALVIKGLAQPALLSTYHEERHEAAQNNVGITNQTMRFLTPQSATQNLFRDAIIHLAKQYPFARALVNTGRLSSPTHYQQSQINLGIGAGVSVPNLQLRVNQRAVDLVSAVAEQGGAIGLLVCDQITAQSLVQILQTAKLAHSIEPAAFYVRVVGAGADVDWHDARDYLVKHFALKVGLVALLRPDLHTAGTVACDQLVSAMRQILGINH